MAERQHDDDQDLRNRDLSRKEVAEMSRAEKLELKRRLEEFVTAMRRGTTAKPMKPRHGKPVKWNPGVHRGR